MMLSGWKVKALDSVLQICSSRIFPTWIALPVLFYLYQPLQRLAPGFDADRYVRRLVEVGNTFFFKRFIRTPFQERMLFLPYCLRAPQCPTLIDAREGLVCPPDCGVACPLQAVKEAALRLGYMDVRIVVSGTLHRNSGALRSRDFIVSQIKLRQPRAVIGCLCTQDLRQKYLFPENLSPGGTLGNHGIQVIPQVVLLARRNCTQSGVDWEGLRQLIGAGS